MPLPKTFTPKDWTGPMAVLESRSGIILGLGRVIDGVPTEKQTQFAVRLDPGTIQDTRLLAPSRGVMWFYRDGTSLDFNGDFQIAEWDVPDAGSYYLLQTRRGHTVARVRLYRWDEKEVVWVAKVVFTTSVESLPVGKEVKLDFMTMRAVKPYDTLFIHLNNLKYPETLGPSTVSIIAPEAAGIREERAAIYGKGHYNHGRILAALYPEGLTLRTAEDFTRFTMFNNLLTKVVRYGLRFSEGGHRDSAIDAGNYAHLLAELDDELSDNRG